MKVSAAKLLLHYLFLYSYTYDEGTIPKDNLQQNLSAVYICLQYSLGKGTIKNPSSFDY